MTEPGCDDEGARVAIGVDLGGTNARAALIDVATGQILDEAKEPVDDHDPGAVASLVTRLVQSLDAGDECRGVGIGFAGMLRGWSGVVVNAPNFGWREVDFRRALRSTLGPRVELYNDLNAIAFGEMRYGAARGVRDVLCVFVGTGLGGGLVTDGRLYVGATNLAGEIGHSKVVPGGRLCGCGQRGCIEAYVSGRNLELRVREELGAGRQQSAAVALAGGVEQVHAGFLDEAARQGDPYAQRLWAEIAPLFGLVLANAVALLNPARLVLGGGVWEGAPELRRQVEAAYRELVNAPSGAAVELRDSTLGDGAGVLGAAALVAEGVFG